ncbi:protein lin-37 homolog [Montipora capricornis]|uniref:protein lin-37 homolog n=1 Tax=Montipora capricornis TaxID=246305 RepID=UPI0035F1ED20
MAKNEENSSGVRSARVRLDDLLKDLSKKTEESIEGEPSSVGGSSASCQMPPPSTPTKRYVYIIPCFKSLYNLARLFFFYLVPYPDISIFSFFHDHLSDLFPTTSRSASGKTPRKRRKKDVGLDDGDSTSQNRNFVMKLFDRSVDFAQFNEDTPLYALARAWMQNKPYGTKAFDLQESIIQDSDSPSSSQDSIMSVTQSNGDSDPKYVYSFPDPLKIKEKSDESKISRPEGPCTIDIHYDLDTAPSLVDLKRNHIDRWKKVKTSWREESIQRQARYAPSIKKIRELFEHQ